MRTAWDSGASSSWDEAVSFRGNKCHFWEAVLNEKAGSMKHHTHTQVWRGFYYHFQGSRTSYSGMIKGHHPFGTSLRVGFNSLPLGFPNNQIGRHPKGQPQRTACLASRGAEVKHVLQFHQTKVTQVSVGLKIRGQTRGCRGQRCFPHRISDFSRTNGLPVDSPRDLLPLKN